MRVGGQSGLELITTYGLMVFIVAVAVAAIFVLSSTPSSVLPSSCSIYGTLRCSDIVYGGSVLGGTKLILLVSVSVQGAVNVNSFSALVGGIRSSSGGCTNSTGGTSAQQGGSLICAADFATNITVAQAYSGTFNITANYCSTTSQPCPSGNAYMFGGSWRTRGVYNAILPTSTGSSVTTVTSVSTTVPTGGSTTTVGPSTTLSTTTVGSTSTTTTSTSTILTTSTTIAATTTIPPCGYFCYSTNGATNPTGPRPGPGPPPQPKPFSCAPGSPVWNQTYVYVAGITSYTACDVYGTTGWPGHNYCPPNQVGGVVGQNSWPFLTCQVCINSSVTNTPMPPLAQQDAIIGCQAFKAVGGGSMGNTPLLGLTPVANTTAYGSGAYYVMGTGYETFGKPAVMGVAVPPANCTYAWQANTPQAYAYSPLATPPPEAGEFGTFTYGGCLFGGFSQSSQAATPMPIGPPTSNTAQPLSITVPGLPIKLVSSQPVYASLYICAASSGGSTDYIANPTYALSASTNLTVIGSEPGNPAAAGHCSAQNLLGSPLAAVIFGTNVTSNYLKYVNSRAASSETDLTYNVTSPLGMTAIMIVCGGGRCDAPGYSQPGAQASAGSYISVPSGCVQQQLMDYDGKETAAVFVCMSQPVGQYTVRVTAASGTAYMSAAAYVFRNMSTPSPSGGPNGCGGSIAGVSYNCSVAFGHSSMLHNTYVLSDSKGYMTVPLQQDQYGDWQSQYGPWYQQTVNFSEPNIPPSYAQTICAMATTIQADAGTATPDWPQPSGTSPYGNYNFTTNHTTYAQGGIGAWDVYSRLYDSLGSAPGWPSGVVMGDGSICNQFGEQYGPDTRPIFNNITHYSYPPNGRVLPIDGEQPNTFGAVNNVTTDYMLPWEYAAVGVNVSGNTEGNGAGGTTCYTSNGAGGGCAAYSSTMSFDVRTSDNLLVFALSCGRSYYPCGVTGLPGPGGSGPGSIGSPCGRSGVVINNPGSAVQYYICNNVSVGSYGVSDAGTTFKLPWAFTGNCYDGGVCQPFAQTNITVDAPPSMALGLIWGENTLTSSTLPVPKINGGVSTTATYICGVIDNDYVNYPYGASLTFYSNFGSTQNSGGCQVTTGDSGLAQAAIAINLPYSGPSTNYARSSISYSSGPGNFNAQFNVPGTGSGGIGVAVVTCSGTVCQPILSAVGNSDGKIVQCKDSASAVGSTLTSSVDIVTCDFTNKQQSYTMGIKGSQNAQYEQAVTYVFSAPYS